MSKMKWECQDCFAEFTEPTKDKQVRPSLFVGHTVGSPDLIMRTYLATSHKLVCPECDSEDIMNPEERAEFDNA